MTEEPAIVADRVGQFRKFVEKEIVDGFVTAAFIRKEFAKVVNAVASEKLVYLFSDDYSGTLVLDRLAADDDTFATYTGANLYGTFVAANRHKIIPRFLGQFYLTFIDEETRTFVKKLKNPVVDFSKLHRLMTVKAKRTLTEVF